MFRQNRCADPNDKMMYMNSEMGKQNNAFNQPSMYADGYAQMNMGMNMGCCNTPMQGMAYQPVYEPYVERLSHREIIHEVPHVCPVNTRIINHHIYRHTYSPCYTACEENVCSNVYEGNCCY